ncbi:hypothetical protein [Leeuwenhoekiella nanhaiensis]|uniref:Uncharacterized protein n=1 Tax=Leeuwenhoekiella nanhaiensis TaxID=1655491 RepID=A0A2G1VMW4_9FLAO|nr:hypothetical protein [Leeuwenhoekiella nanhaiensis]PHQ28074.1 hypothetical protein CJ305_16795 [Leeuwenhoekiella nanhaiensis]
MHLLYELALICAGILLAVATLTKYDGKMQIVSKIAGALQPFAAVIGGICLILGIWYLLRPFCFFRDAVSILAGLTLLGGALENRPSLHDFFNRASAVLNPYRVIIGIIALILGVLGLFNISFIC